MRGEVVGEGVGEGEVGEGENWDSIFLRLRMRY